MKRVNQHHVGVGLRPIHYPQLLKQPATQLSWFEAISENFMNSQGRPLAMLEFIRRDYPVALHGVSMSIAARQNNGSGVRADYLKRLRTLADRIQPFIVSDHLCWTGLRPSNIHDLLPFPFTDEALSWISMQISQVQDALARPLVLENVSTYLTFKDSTYTEWEFLVELAKRSGCKLLLDINNVFVNANNHKFDAIKFINAIPTQVVAQIHLAGHTDMGTHLFDTHSTHVAPKVWELFAHAMKRLAHVPVLIEWDADIPPFEILEAEAVRARDIMDAVDKLSSKTALESPPFQPQLDLKQLLGLYENSYNYTAGASNNSAASTHHNPHDNAAA